MDSEEIVQSNAHSFSRYLLRVDHVLETVLGTVKRTGRHIRKSNYLSGAYVFVLRLMVNYLINTLCGKQKDKKGRNTAF